MTAPATGGAEDLLALEAEAVGLVRRWLHEASGHRAEAAARRLSGLLQDEHGLDFAVQFIDGVIRPEDPATAAARLRSLATSVPRSVPPHLRAALRAGGTAGTVAPRLVVPVVRRALRGMLEHLVLDSTESRLGRSIARLRQPGVRLNLNLLGEAVLGTAEAARRLEGTRRLLARDDVDYVSVKVSSVVAPHSPWAFDEAVTEIVEALTPLYQQAAEAPTTTFINLDMEEYRDLELTLAVFMTLLDRPDLADLEAGIVLQAYLPDAPGAMQRLQEWAAARRARGGAPVKVRLVKGANLPMELADADVHGWPPATWESKQLTDTCYKMVLDYALRPEHVDAVRVGVAGHNLFDLALAWLLAGRRGVREGMDVEMLLGMAPGQAEAVRREVGGLLLYTPVVSPEEFDVAISYLVRRLEEGASDDNFLSALFDLDSDPATFERERRRFSASLHDLPRMVADPPVPRRTQDRRTEEPRLRTEGFTNEPDTDPSLAGNREWGREVLARSATSDAGRALIAEHRLETVDQLDAVFEAARAAAPAWAGRSAEERAGLLREAARVLASRRGLIAEVMAAECGKTLEESDPEVSEAIDFANHYATCAEDLPRVEGARFVPDALTVVTPPWNFPVAIPTGTMLGPLAAGSTVVAKPAPQARRTGAVVVQALWDAGIPREVLHLVDVDEGTLGKQLISDPRVDQVVLTGGFETAELFRSFRPDLPLQAETSGKNAIVVTPSADLDLAAQDVVRSAFGHAGQKCSAASLAILVGPVASSRRFHDQLRDAAASMVVGQPSDPRSRIGPVIEPASGKLLRALTTLGPGEEWLLEPRRLDEEGRLWAPGIRTGVQPDSEYHLTEYFGPVLGVMAAESLAEAVALQNRVVYGLTAGLHSLDADEVAQWLDCIEAGNLYVNRGITGAVVRRQPFGGWKRSVVGTGTKAGGPSYLFGFGHWERRTSEPRPGVQSPLGEELLAALGEVPEEEAAFLRRAAASDLDAWEGFFGTPYDATGLWAEHNVLRHLPRPVTVRLAEGGSPVDLVRCLHAGLVVGAPLTVSTADPLPARLAERLAGRGVVVREEGEATFVAQLGAVPDVRVRLVGAPGGDLLTALGGRADVAVHDGEVTEAGRVEILPFVHEQAISLTAHRFGTPHDLAPRLTEVTRR